MMLLVAWYLQCLFLLVNKEFVVLVRRKQKLQESLHVMMVQLVFFALFFFAPLHIHACGGSTISIEGDEFWHMSKVLRLATDDRVELFDGKGGIVEGVVTATSRNSIHITAAGDVFHLSPVGPFWHVAAAFGSLKGGRGDWLIEKCTELGAKSVIPLLSKRSPSVSDGRNDRWNRVVTAATKQCQRLHSMVVRNPMDLSDILAEAGSYEAILLADACATSLGKGLPRVEVDWNGLLLIGPEGDFTEEEKEAIIKAGALPVGLGPRRLRVETAAIAMLSAVTLLGDSQCSTGT
ncbi:hypothetical protein GOP47_0024712 [Adiantum capillus-veneris]|uniref:16S rRNA (uracil(1498)-N(3))-methyltransferase n=1 Tax=Adiantum capillus-veneris TaxID=13818 RepID=A0A9D4Z4L4_ADICA|nr:hypothetical protein GOP47_0024712 [Adiantum capillus-veneris]